jgi:hypothetical protein
MMGEAIGKRICETLRVYVDIGRDVNPHITPKSQNIIKMLYLVGFGHAINERLIIIEDGFKRWLSAGQATQDLGTQLHSDIDLLQGSIQTWRERSKRTPPAFVYRPALIIFDTQMIKWSS